MSVKIKPETFVVYAGKNATCWHRRPCCATQAEGIDAYDKAMHALDAVNMCRLGELSPSAKLCSNCVDQRHRAMHGDTA